MIFEFGQKTKRRTTLVEDSRVAQFTSVLAEHLKPIETAAASFHKHLKLTTQLNTIE